MKKIIFFILFFFTTQEKVLAQLTTTVGGNGKTCSEARNDALSNAINKAYGSLIYSTTEIKNDKLISDEINMLTSGNILNYEEITPCSESNGKWYIQLSVTVSQTKLKNFIEGKGKSVGISGELLKQKSDQDVAATISELAIIKSLLFQLDSLISDPFDYEISIGNVTIKDGKSCDLPAEISIKSNINTFNTYLNLSKEIEKIALNKTDQVFRSVTLNELNYPFEINNKEYILRNKESLEQIKVFYSKITSKLDDYIVVDGCLNEMYLEEKNKVTNLKENIFFFPEPGFIAKIIYGNYTTTIDEMGSLERINIFSNTKAKEYKNEKLLTGELNLLKYSETNPLEFMGLENNLLKTLDDLSREKEVGEIGVVYNIYFSKEGVNKSSIQNLIFSQNNYQQIIEKSINQIKLNPSKLCGSFIKTTDSIKLNYKWKTYSSKFIFQHESTSNYSQYFNNENLPYGKYFLTVKEKELNNNKFNDIFISNYQTRGPFTALYSVVLPGWGTRRVTFNKNNGWFRFGLVVAPLAISILNKVGSIMAYNNAINPPNSPTAQTSSSYFKDSQEMNKNSLIWAGIGAAFYVFDIVWVIGKGFGNMSEKEKIKDKIKTSEFQIQTQPLK
jgi:hypothetical protein